MDILERAEGVDPTGERTIGVLTKTDLIGPGAEDEVIEVVHNRRKPLALGYTMMKNRSQKDIKDGISTAKARYAHLNRTVLCNSFLFYLHFLINEGIYRTLY